MAKPKNPPQSAYKSFRDEMAAKRAAETKLPLVAERWYVEEKDPDWKTYNEYDYGPDYHTGDTRNASGYLQTEEEAIKFVEDHVPDKEGGKFTIRHQYLRTHTKVWNEWGWV